MYQLRVSAGATLAFILAVAAAGRPAAQAKPPAPKDKLDADYTAKIKEYLQDPRITTELVDHLPASDTVPTPLKFLGHMPGIPGELTHAADRPVLRRDRQGFGPDCDVEDREDRGGRDMVLLAVADEATIKSIAKYKSMIGQLTDPRITSETQAQQLIKTAKPIYCG